MRKLPLMISAAALVAGGAAFARGHDGGHKMMMDRDMTRAEAQQHAGEKFTKMDANGDGMLNDADQAARLAAKFDTLDANHDGAISRDEFTTGHSAMPHARHGGGDGPRHGMGGKMGGHRAMMMEMADANKDGAVSAAEFTETALAMFDKADADKNGTVTSAEHRAAMDAMHDNKAKGHDHQPDAHVGH